MNQSKVEKSLKFLENELLYSTIIIISNFLVAPILFSPTISIFYMKYYFHQQYLYSIWNIFFTNNIYILYEMPMIWSTIEKKCLWNSFRYGLSFYIYMYTCHPIFSIYKSSIWQISFKNLSFIYLSICPSVLYFYLSILL